MPRGPMSSWGSCGLPRCLNSLPPSPPLPPSLPPSLPRAGGHLGASVLAHPEEDELTQVPRLNDSTESYRWGGGRRGGRGGGRGGDGPWGDPCHSCRTTGPVSHLVSASLLSDRRARCLELTLTPLAVSRPGASSARPDFGVLLYPVISMDRKVTHHGSKVGREGGREGRRKGRRRCW
jgi:hypothetical protein